MARATALPPQPTPALSVRGTFDPLARATHDVYACQMTKARKTPQTRPHMALREPLPDDVNAEGPYDVNGDIDQQRAVGHSQSYSGLKG